jgi:predicted ATPase
MGGLSREVRRLENKWESNIGWPLRLEWLKIEGLRGWTGARLDFTFPLTAIVGENGVGKSTILQAAATVYRSRKGTKESWFPAEFFPRTAWDEVTNVRITYGLREGKNSIHGYLHKPSDRWREVPERRKREVKFIDLGRILPISSQVGYSKLAKAAHREKKRIPFDEETLIRYSSILGRNYDDAGYSLTDVDDKRWVPVVSVRGSAYSGFHQGAGESVIADLLKTSLPKYGIVLIDELETSLHPRAQRRLVRDLADLCRILELQIIVTTHSPYILAELPPEGRVYILDSPNKKELVTGVSPFFAMTQMDDDPHPEADIFVEDDEARILLEELLVVEKKDLARRCRIIPYGTASVGRALGIMVKEKRFPVPTAVFLDADQTVSQGCYLLPGNDAPEIEVFQELKKKSWFDVPTRISRPASDVIDELERAMTRTDHHEWVRSAADRLLIGGSELWRAMTNAWMTHCVPQKERARIAGIVQDTIDGLEGLSKAAQKQAQERDQAKAEATKKIEEAAKAIKLPPPEPLPRTRSGQGNLFDFDDDGAQNLGAP